MSRFESLFRFTAKSGRFSSLPGLPLHVWDLLCICCAAACGAGAEQCAVGSGQWAVLALGRYFLRSRLRMKPKMDSNIMEMNETRPVHPSSRSFASFLPSFLSFFLLLNGYITVSAGQMPRRPTKVMLGTGNLIWSCGHEAGELKARLSLKNTSLHCVELR
jgi:hypothetical protein